jgi:hypothetical protein
MKNIEQDSLDSQAADDRKPLTLGLLLEEVCDENLHAEIDTGTPVGAEVWAQVPVDDGDADPADSDRQPPAST